LNMYRCLKRDDRNIVDWIDWNASFSFQERLLAKYDHQENEAPVIVQRINEEASALREQLRRTRERYDLKCEKLHQTSEELDRTQRLLKKMKSLVDDKKLAERDELSRKLSKAQQDIEVKDVTIRVSLIFSSIYWWKMAGSLQLLTLNNVKVDCKNWFSVWPSIVMLTVKCFQEKKTIMHHIYYT